MPRDTAAPRGGSWTLMLADVVALMLAFFVLSFSMREMIGSERAEAPSIADGVLAAEAVAGGGDAAAPAHGRPLALAPDQGRTAEQLRAPERTAAAVPSLAYLAAIVQGDGSAPSPSRIWHDDTMLVVELEALLDDGLTEPLRRSLVTLAFLARRFDLDVAVAVPAGGDRGLGERAAHALELRRRLAEATGLAAPEVTFAAPAGAAAPTGLLPPLRVALLVKAASGAATGQSP
jgi:flagellar motor protein MotB